MTRIPAVAPTVSQFAWPDIIFGIGVAMITVGVSLWSLPSAVVLFGIILCAISARVAQRTAPVVAGVPAVRSTDAPSVEHFDHPTAI